MGNGCGSFSVVTPNYNMAHFLEETIESVLVNLQPGDEYFIIDGGSTDESVDIIRRYEVHLTGWVSEPDKGYADALVKGFQRCTGEFLCWINSGDLLLKGTLQVTREILAQTGADLIFGDDVSIDEQSRVFAHNHGRVRSLKHHMLYGGWTPWQDACYWRRSAYEQIGGLNSDLKYAADYDFFLRTCWAGRALYVPKIFSAFRRHEGQKSISGSAQYAGEKQQSRNQMLRHLSIPMWKRLALEPYYWFAVRWWYHVARHFHRPAVQLGVPVSSLAVSGESDAKAIIQASR
jgi:glycosyltransferase involved in cell wall biosynthesis